MRETISNTFFEEETIRRAREGNGEAALLALRMVTEKIEARRLDSSLLDYLTECLRLFLDEEVPIDTALGVEAILNTGGRPAKYDPTEVAAVDLLLRDHANLKSEKAIEWIETNIGADRRYVQLKRKEYDARYNGFKVEKLMDSRPKDDLLDLAGSLREKVAEVLPQT